jgi:SAM-dependent methyltransferase
MNESKQPGPVFDQYADHYGEALDKGLSLSGEGRDYFAHGRVAWLAHCLRQENRHVGKMMDFGCGTGSAVPYFLELLDPNEVIGVDVSAKCLEAGRNLYASERVRFIQRNEFEPAGDVDLVFCNGVFHHVPPPERLQTARWIHDCLKPGGFFALCDNNPWNPGARLVMRRIPFDRDAVMISAGESRELVRSVGFKVLRTDFQFIFPRELGFLRGLERPLAGLPLGAQYQVLAEKSG